MTKPSSWPKQACWEYHKQGKTPVSVIRTGSACGPRDRLLADGDYINALMPTLMWPRGCNPRYSIVQAHDIAESAILVATSDKAVGQVYNVAGPDLVTPKDFIKA